MKRAKWNDPSYQRMVSVELDENALIIKFQDGFEITLKPDILLPPNAYGADWESFQFNPYEIVVPTSLGETEIPWSSVRLLVDPDFAAYWAQKAEEQAKDIGQRIRELRKSRNLTSKEVAKRAGISPQSLSRIEKGHHDVVFTTLEKILAAMGCSIQDLARVNVTPPSLNSLIKRLENTGINREWLISQVLPPDIVSYIKGNSDEDEDLVNEVAHYISRIFKWSPEQILGSQSLDLDSSIIQNAKFKTRSRIQVKQVSAYALYAHYLSLLVLQAIEHIQTHPVPENPSTIRSQVAKIYGPLNLDNLLRYIWDLGIPVIPLFDPGMFHGACWNISGRSLIVLKQITKYQGRWLFDLAHELGHVVKHLKDQNSIIEAEEISPFGDSEQEWEANDFATDLLFSGRAEELAEMSVEIAKNKVENLKSAVLQVATYEHIPVDLLANYLAFRLSKTNNINWWGAANNLQITEPSPRLLARQILLERIKPERLSPEDYNLLLRAFEV